MARDVDRLLEITRRPGVVQHLEDPVRLASGAWSRDFIDGKLAVANPADLVFVGEEMMRVAEKSGASFAAVGGMVLGAVPFTFGVALAARCRWFLVRKEAKGRGTNRWIEGARLEPGDEVMLVDDVITTGGSTITAAERVRETGAKVVFATAFVDRGDTAREHFERANIPYEPLLTYHDLGIEPVGAVDPPDDAA